MSSSKHHVILTLVIHGTGGHSASWRTEENRDAFWDIDHYVAVAKIAHEGNIDSLWLPDLPMTIAPADHAPLHSLDPTLLMTALAMAVPDIGVVPTISTSYNHPYTVARHIATLDAMSGGRGGVNAITSYNPRIAQNYGEPEVDDYDRRYRRAHEFLELLGRLSDSWTIPKNGAHAQRGLLFDPDLRRTIDYEGEIFSVRGPLNVPQYRYGRPLLSVAGGSDHSLDLAAKHADLLYAAAVNKEATIAMNENLRARAVGFGRRGDDIKVMPGFTPVIGSTMEEANRKLDLLAQQSGYATDPVERIAEILSLDPKDLHPDRELTEAQLAAPSPTWSRPIGFFYSITELARRERLTVRELARRFQLDIGHRLVVGTPDVIAEAIIDWWQDGAADGFALRVQNLREDTRIVADEVIPILRKAKAYPEGYKKESLRSRFGVAA